MKGILKMLREKRHGRDKLVMRMWHNFWLLEEWVGKDKLAKKDLGNRWVLLSIVTEIRNKTEKASSLKAWNPSVIKRLKMKTQLFQTQLFQMYPNLAQLCCESFSGKSPLDNKERKWLEVMKLRQDLLATEFMGVKLLSLWSVATIASLRFSHHPQGGHWGIKIIILAKKRYRIS